MRRILFSVLLGASFLVFGESTENIYNKLVQSNGISNPFKLVVVELDLPFAVTQIVEKRILISTGMLRSTRNSEEVAKILGHELAHTMLAPSIIKYENEYNADKVGMVLMRKAGYDSCKGAKYDLRGRNTPSKTHPSSLDRYKKEVTEAHCKAI